MCRHAHRHHLVRNIWYLLIYTIPCFLLQVNCQICQRIHIGIVQDDGSNSWHNNYKSHFRQCMYPSGSICMGAFCGAEMDGRTAKPPGRNGTSRREACGSFCFFCLSSVHVWHWQAAFCRCARSFVYRRSVFRRYLPVHDRSFAATSSGVPVAITVPPPSPPSGPMSMR